LSTAPLGNDAGKVATDMGIDLDILPFIETEFIVDDNLAGIVNDFALEPAVVVFTSKHAVMSVAKMLHNDSKYWQIYCLGNKTLNTVNQYFSNKKSEKDKNSSIRVADNAERLARLIINDNVKNIVFFCGDKRMDILPEMLKDAGVVVKEVVVYRTIETPHVVGKQYDGILFFSPSGVSSFFNKNSVDQGTTLFAIGKTTAEEVRQYTTNRLQVSSKPIKQQVLSDAIFYLLNN